MKYIAEQGQVRVKQGNPFVLDTFVPVFIGITAIPSIILGIFAEIYGWFYDFGNDGNVDMSWLSILFTIVTLVWAVSTLVLLLAEWPVSFKPKEYISVKYLEPFYAYNNIYKEAINDCIEEIKSGTFDEPTWRIIFVGLNKQMQELIDAEAIAKSEAIKAIPRKDYNAWMKETNELYLGGFK